MFSTTKGATAACANLLAQRGELDIDAPVAQYWPEFAQAGKENIPVRWLLSHKAGLPTVDAKLTTDEVFAWDPIIDALEAQEPYWEPGTAHGYHAITYGYLVGEVVRRVTGKSLGTFFHDEIAAPLGLEFWIGLPEEQEHRVAPLVGDGSPATARKKRRISPRCSGPTRSIATRAVAQRRLRRPRQRLQQSRAPRRGDARGERHHERAVAGALLRRAHRRRRERAERRVAHARAGRLRRAPARPRAPTGCCRSRASSCPRTIGLGFWTASEFAPFGGEGAFGHSGAGGSVGFADPEAGIAGGYVMNRMMQGLAGDPRSRPLIKASYDAVGAPAAFV